MPGFVQLGAIAVASQLAVVGGVYASLRWRHPGVDHGTRRRARRLLGLGTGVAALGQLAAIGAVGMLRMSPLLSFESALVVQDAGLLVAAVGYLGVIGGFVAYARGVD